MVESANPQEPESPGPSDGSEAAQQAQIPPLVWLRDLNAPAIVEPEWSSDPEALRDA